MDSDKAAADCSSSKLVVVTVSAAGFLFGGLAGAGLGLLTGTGSELNVVIYYVVGAIAGTATAAGMLRARKRKAGSR